MADFYRGKRVSVYRKQQQVGTDTTLTSSSPIISEIQPRGSAAGDRQRFMKNFRGLVTFYPADATSYNDYSAGYMGLVRFPGSEGFSASNIDLESSSFLHPVPFAMGGAPLTMPYEFKGITLGQAEKLYFVVKPVITFGPVACVWQMLWAQKDLVTPS